MTLTLELGELLTNTASVCVIIGALYGAWKFLKRHWNTPIEPPE